ncbi:MAG: efflux RND transporter periplasmic adaptor subunit [Hydrogenophilaceae bacterium]|nr:efflux RND transporter periplasmic adaptor subunit [Hydrogenophilaceae bacterium]
MILALVTVLISCGKPTGEETDKNALPKNSAAHVTTVRLGDLVFHPELSAQAQVTSRNISKIAAEIAARIEALPVEAGQRIPANKVVARLDCRDAGIALQQAQAQLATASARLRLAEQQLKRSEDLASRNFISGDALDQRRTEVNVILAERQLSRAQVEAAQRNVGKCVVVSPFDAVVEAKLANVGELASPGTPLLTLWDMSGLEVSAEVQQKDADSLARANPVMLETPEADFPLKLKRISPALNTSARTREARLGFVRETPHPGASGRIRWRTDEPYLPAEYVLLREGRYGIFVQEANKARFIALPDAQEGRPVMVSLPLDTFVISEGRFALRDGQEISVSKSTTSAQTAR